MVQEECKNVKDIVDVYSLDGEEESIDSSELEEFPKNKIRQLCFQRRLK